MSPERPEATLLAVGAKLGTASGELDHDRTLAAIGTVLTQINQLPAHSIGIQILNHRGGRSFSGFPVATEGDTLRLCQIIAILNGNHHSGHGGFTFDPNNLILSWRGYRESGRWEIRHCRSWSAGAAVA